MWLSGIDVNFILWPLLLGCCLAGLVSLRAGKVVHPAWVGYSLGWVVGLFGGGIVYQLMVIGLFLVRASSGSDTLGDATASLMPFTIFNFIFTCAVGGGLTAVLVWLWRRR